MKTIQTKETITQLIAMNIDSMSVAPTENVKRDMEIELFEAIRLKCERQLFVLKNEKPQTAATVQG